MAQILISRRALGWLLLLLVTAAIWLAGRIAETQLTDGSVLTGWSLIVLVFVLGAYRVLKRLVMVPGLRARQMFQLHVFLGLTALWLFVLHTGFRWPSGVLETLLWWLFVVVSVSGLIGLQMTRSYPAMLRIRGEDLIYERIPGFAAEMRRRLHALLLQSAACGNNHVLVEFYRSRLIPMFAGPKFRWRYLISALPWSHGIQRELKELPRYLSDSEAEDLRKLQALVQAKDDLDFHYTVQSALKLWLWVHVPATAALALLALVHLVVVYAFRGA